MAPCCARNADAIEGENENCGDCRTWEEQLYWKRFQSFSFCMILSSVTEFRKHLAIPKKFAHNASALLPPKVTLRGPSLASWSITLTKRGESGDDLFLTDGWEEFARAYSLQASDILIFKFDGVSAFDILIFDGENMCENESAYFVKKCSHANAENPRKRPSSEANLEEQDEGLTHRANKHAREEVSDEIYDRSKYTHFYSRSRKKKLLRKHVSSKASPRKIISPTSNNNSKPSAEHGQSNVQNESLNTEMNKRAATEASPQETPHINGSIFIEATSQSEYETSSDEAPPLRVVLTQRRPRGRPRKYPIASTSKVSSSGGRPRKPLGAYNEDSTLGSPESSSTRHVSDEGKLALEMARKQMTGTSFIVVMRPTTVCKRFILNFPPGWCRVHLSPKSQDAYIRFGDKTFITRLTYNPHKIAAQIYGGWKQVVRETQLKLYDVCLFDIASRKDDSITLDATIFRADLQRVPDPVIPIVVEP